MSDKEIPKSDRVEADEDLTTSAKVLAAKAILEEATEGTTVIQRHLPKPARFAWMRRVVDWLARR